MSKDLSLEEIEKLLPGNVLHAQAVEYCPDEYLTLGTIRKYAAALGLRVRIEFEPEDTT